MPLTSFSVPTLAAAAPASPSAGSALAGTSAAGAALDYLRRMIHASSAIVLERNKDYLIESRLTPVLAEEGLASFPELVLRLSRPGAERLRQRVIEAMTTHETFFFRDNHPFEAMRKVVLPEIADSGRDRRTMSIWSAAASSGQELYSLAMLVREAESRFPGWTIRMLGTDISADILAKARAGRYSQLEVNRGLPAPMLVRHFQQAGLDWQIKDDLRRMVEFRQMNLIEPWHALQPMDVVFLRNVLIYFDVDAKRRILDKLASVMRPGGLLFLGGVETTLNLSTRFAEVRLERCTCYRLVA